MESQMHNCSTVLIADMIINIIFDRDFLVQTQMKFCFDTMAVFFGSDQPLCGEKSGFRKVVSWEFFAKNQQAREEKSIEGSQT